MGEEGNGKNMKCDDNSAMHNGGKYFLKWHSYEVKIFLEGHAKPLPLSNLKKKIVAFLENLNFFYNSPVFCFFKKLLQKLYFT